MSKPAACVSWACPLFDAFLSLRCTALFLLVFSGLVVAADQPLVIGLTAEFGVKGSHAAQSIEKGIQLALDEINAAGGVLNGRKLVLEKRDDRGVPARGVDNYRDFVAMPEVVAVFCGRFSPVALEIAQVAPRAGLPLLDPWSAADDITQPRAGLQNYAFRLSLTDSWAMQAMLRHLQARGLKNIAMFVPNTAWGRSNEAALLAYVRRTPGISHETYWYNWGDTDFRERLQQLGRRQAQALLMVANELEGLTIARQMAELPEAQRLPIVAHWGILGGDFAGQAGELLEQLDLAVVYTFSFADYATPKASAVAAALKRRFGDAAPRLHAQVGFAHAYDLTHLLAAAINRAGRADRAAIRTALEQLGPHEGLVRSYARPFTPGRHEALAAKDVRIGRFLRDGSIRMIGKN